MRSQAVPSYQELFNDASSYSTLIAGLTNESVITICIALINELTSNEEKYELQKRIYAELSATFSSEEKESTDKALTKFWNNIDLEFGVLFHRSYLLKMILAELNAPRVVEETTGQQEFVFFKAYVRIVTDVNQEQSAKATFTALSEDEDERKLELLWTPIISSYEFNERPHLPFEQFKVMTFLNYADKNYHPALGQYLEINHKESVGNLLSSFDQVNKTALASDPTARLKRLAYLKPENGVDTTHLDRQTINKQAEKEFGIIDIKMFPLYLTRARGYMVIDPYFYMRKNYYGPFFELRTQTSLKDKLDFNSYSSQVSQALEANCFKPIFTLLCNGLPAAKVKVDDGSSNAPDGYCRIEKLIFVFEYKASIFPETLSQTGEVKKISKFLDKKFVSSDDGEKGVGQLTQKLKTLFDGGYKDDKLNLDNSTEKYRIYPVIIHHDFYFSLPGVNNYLLQKFEKGKPKHDNFEVMELVVMNLSILYDLVMANLNITILDRFFIDYYNFLQEVTLKLYTVSEDKTNNFLAANMSFDEFFNQYILKELPHPPDQIRKGILEDLLGKANISFVNFNRPFNGYNADIDHLGESKT